MLNVQFDDYSSLQLVLLAEFGSLEVLSASLLVLFAFLGSASCAKDFLAYVFTETFEGFCYRDCL